jgi:hypothetical protein
MSQQSKPTGFFLATLCGRYKVKPIWMIDHIDIGRRKHVLFSHPDKKR